MKLSQHPKVELDFNCLGFSHPSKKIQVDLDNFKLKRFSLQDRDDGSKWLILFGANTTNAFIKAPDVLLERIQNNLVIGLTWREIASMEL